MKAHIPIIISLVMLSALLVSTLYYITSRTTHVGETLYGYTLSEWILINSDLETLCLLSLTRGSQNASRVFEETFLDTYEEVFGDFYASLNNFRSALRVASIAASHEVDREIDRLLLNWVKYKRNEGYIIDIVNSTGYYNVRIFMDGEWSVGRGVAGVHIVVDMVSPYGEHRVFNRVVEAVYEIRFWYGHPYSDNGIHWPVSLIAYIRIDSARYYYLIPHEDMYLLIISDTLYYLDLIGIVDNTITAYPISAFYYGAGVSYALFRIPYESLMHFAISIIDHKDELVTGFSERGYPMGLHLWATLTSINIDNIIVYSALKVAFKFEIWRYYSRCNWGIRVRFVGDETSWAGP